MGAKSKKNNYLVQGTVLIAASFIARAIGLIYRIPLTNILGPEGNAYYSTANEIYAMILIVSTFSLPLAVSKLVSERLHQGQYKNAYRVFRCSLKFALICGGVMSVLTFLLGGVLTKYVMQNELAHYALRALAPAIFIFAIVGVFRGFFQGHETMIPTAVSQILEQIVHAVVTVICAGVMMSYGVQLAKEKGNSSLGPALGAAGGTFGTVVSVAVTLLFMLVVYSSYRGTLKRQIRRDQVKRVESDRLIYRAIILTILPVILSTLVYNISTVLDQGVFNHILKGQGYNAKQYNTIWGLYVGEFRVLMNVPLSIASCLAPSIVPALTAAMAENDLREAGIKVRDSIRYTMIITIPCAVGLAALAGPIIQMLFEHEGALQLSVGIMQSGALMIVLLALSTLTTGILQGLGELKAPLYHSTIALIVHVIVLVIGLKVWVWNIYAVVFANTVFALIVCLLNALAIRRAIHYRQELRKTFILPIVAAGAMGIAAYAVYSLFALFAGNTFPTILAILVGAVVYLVVLIKLHGLTEKEIYRLPKGTMMVDILKKCRIL